MTKACNHPAHSLRPAIGPPSGILCGLCGQDVPVSLVLGTLCAELAASRERIRHLERALCAYTEADQCTQCWVFLPCGNLFRGIKTAAGRLTLCVDCLTQWFDNEDGNLDDLHIPYLASYMLAMDIRSSHDKHGRLADMAHQAFPQLAAEIRRQMR